MKGVIVAVVIIALLFAIGVGWYIGGLNKVVTLHEAVSGEWSQVETQLQRRNDLIPNLVSTVKGYAAHEKEIFSEVARLRSQWAESSGREQQIETANKTSSAISRLLLVAENYPNLKASENFLALQSQLEGTENRIAVARRRYNLKVRGFNTYIRTVFGGFFAGKRGLMEPEIYFEADEASKENPKVSF
ncbi:MAG: LemA family protein [Candidatus Omnitrophica bacterium]|nr:LemA family protein [Candidatus Omnitrophota bacterium]